MRYSIYVILVCVCSTLMASTPLRLPGKDAGYLGYVQVLGSPENAGVGIGGLSYMGPHGIDGALTITTLPFRNVLYSMWSCDLRYLRFLSRGDTSGFWGFGVGLFNLYTSDTYHANWNEPAIRLFQWSTLQVCAWPDRISSPSLKLLPTVGYIWGRHKGLTMQLQLQLPLFYVHRLSSWLLSGWGCAPQIALSFGYAKRS